MENPTYQVMKDFMLNYCSDYSQYANDAETIERMDSYWAPDFQVIAYFNTHSKKCPVIYSSRQEFKTALIETHKQIKDWMRVREIVIDEQTQKAVLLLSIQKTYRESGEKTEIDAIGSYQLEWSVDQRLSIKRLDFFWNAPTEIRELGY